MIDFVGKRHWYFLISAILVIPSLIYLILFGLRPGIDFTGGSVLMVQLPATAQPAEVRQVFDSVGLGDAIIQRTGDDSYQIRTRTLAEEQRDSAGNVTKPSEKQQIIDALKSEFGLAEDLGYTSVSPVVASETVRNAALAILAASLAILLYLTYVFRKVSNPFRYGICAVAALVHDTIFVLGVFAFLGHHFEVEVDAMFITAILTVIGYSVHDTIVVFDRIRENLRRGVGVNFDDTVNQSVLQTIGRSLNTSITLVLTLLALLLFGGVTIQSFILVLLIGLIVGTYSSIFNASQLLVVWEHGDLGRLWRRLRFGKESDTQGVPIKA